MELIPEEISNIIAGFANVELQKPFVKVVGTDIIVGKVCVTEQEAKLVFDVQVLPMYPMQFHDNETIRFISGDLLEYDHVNADGSICVHTLHSTDLKIKLSLDFESLRHWIRKYYIQKQADDHYEHIVIPEKPIKGRKSVFLFTEVDHLFKKHSFGYMNYSLLSSGEADKVKIDTYVIQSFQIGKESVCCKWSQYYLSLPKNEGLYYYMESPPIKKKRFAVDTWEEMEPYVNQEFLSFLYDVSKNVYKSGSKPQLIPILLGYKVSATEIHWQATLVFTDNFPNYGEKVLGWNRYLGRLKGDAIYWCSTRNCSYQYFFGRGALASEFTYGRILIIGIGAIGSMVARTLVRGGALNITLIDHDVKEPENICRSEYWFVNGITGKVHELDVELVRISPFVEVNWSERLLDAAKWMFGRKGVKEALEDIWKEYDFIIDCSTDNDVAVILDGLDIKGHVISISITNHAKELVCAVKPNLYNWIVNIYDKLGNDTADLYNPLGCWSPTFKASYTDISVLVQYAIKQLDHTLKNDRQLRNFYLSTTYDGGYTIKMHQF